jgi:hypothetical protein
MDEGLDNRVMCFGIHGEPVPSLIAGGIFTHPINEPQAYRVAAWTGSAWAESPFEPGLSGTSGSWVDVLTDWDPDGAGPLNKQMVAGGSFQNTVSGGPPIFNNIARWDGSAWQPIGDGVGISGAIVDALSPWDPDGPGPQDDVLVVGGTFTMAGGLPGAYISAAGVCATAPCNPCDANCDEAIDGQDVQAFINVLLGFASPCAACAGDTNGNSVVEATDVDSFVECLFN